METGEFHASCCSSSPTENLTQQTGEMETQIGKSQGLEFTESSRWARYHSEGSAAINSFPAPLRQREEVLLLSRTHSTDGEPEA